MQSVSLAAPWVTAPWHGQPFASFHKGLVLLALLTFSKATLSAPADGLPSTLQLPIHHRAPQHAALSYCPTLVGHLSHHHIDQIRAQFQHLSHVQRKGFDLQILAEMKTAPAPDKEFDRQSHAIAFNTSKTLKEIQADIASNKKEQDVLSSKIRDQLRTLGGAAGLAGASPGAADVDLQRVQHCVMSRVNNLLAPDRPEVSFVLNYYKRPWMIPYLVQNMTGCSKVLPIELVVNVDHPAEYQEWSDVVQQTNGMVVPVFSYNLHEARGLNRAAAMARGKYLVVIQDDDVFPGCAWLARVHTIFERYPLVGMVGLKNFLWAFGEGNTNAGMWFRDPGTGTPMQFVLAADMAPMALRKSAFAHVGGFDETMSEPGVCGIIGDWELCTRMWLAGWQVAYHAVKTLHDPTHHEGGTHLPGTEGRCWDRQQVLAMQAFEERVDRWDGPIRTALAEHVRDLNFRHLWPINAPQIIRSCPFALGCPPVPI